MSEQLTIRFRGAASLPLELPYSRPIGGQGKPQPSYKTVELMDLSAGLVAELKVRCSKRALGDHMIILVLRRSQTSACFGSSIAGTWQFSLRGGLIDDVSLYGPPSPPPTYGRFFRLIYINRNHASSVDILETLPSNTQLHRRERCCPTISLSGFPAKSILIRYGIVALHRNNRLLYVERRR